jgi:cytochrome c6
LSKTKVSVICAATVLALTGAVPVLAFAGGADTYKAKCAMCHGQDGSGNTPVGQRLKVRDLRSADVQNQSSESIAGIVTNGQKAMPAFAKSLSADQIKDVVGYLRSIAAK